MQNGTSASQGQGVTNDNQSASATNNRKSQTLPRKDRHTKRDLRLARAPYSVARRPTACETPPCRLLLPSPADPKACRHPRPQRQAGNRPDREPARRGEGLGRKRHSGRMFRTPEVCGLYTCRTPMAKEGLRKVVPLRVRGSQGSPAAIRHSSRYPTRHIPSQSLWNGLTCRRTTACRARKSDIAQP